MSIISIIFIALSLSLDSFAVSVICGSQSIKNKISLVLKIPFIFAFLQTLFAISGWLSGFILKNIISTYDHWLAFILLFIIGIKMLYEAYQQEEKKLKKINFLIICGLGAATSIDAIAVGLSLSLLNINIYSFSLILFVVTYIFSLAGLFFGKKIGDKFSKIEIFGGLILIFIGLKILWQHLK